MPLDNDNNHSYIGLFYVGSGEKQPIKILLDTGSANSWISGYDKDLSTGGTFSEPDDPDITTIHFGSGDLSGYFVHDLLTIGNPDDDAPEGSALVL